MSKYECINQRELAGILPLLAEEFGVGPEDVQAIFLVGSFKEGLATPYSDIDLVVLVKEPEKYVGAPEGYMTGMILGRRAEIWIMSHSAYSEVVSSAGAAMDGLSMKEIELRHKLLKPQIIYDQSGTCGLLSPESSKVFDEQVCSTMLSNLPYMFLDYKGFLEVEDEDSASLVAQAMLSASIDALLAINGDTYVKAKWRIARLRRAECFSFEMKEWLVSLLKTTYGPVDIFAINCLSIFRLLALKLYYGVDYEVSPYGRDGRGNPPFLFIAIPHQGEFILSSLYSDGVVNPAIALVALIHDGDCDFEELSAKAGEVSWLRSNFSSAQIREIVADYISVASSLGCGSSKRRNFGDRR